MLYGNYGQIIDPIPSLYLCMLAGNTELAAYGSHFLPFKESSH
jgi:hypothetical protein